MLFSAEHPKELEQRLPSEVEEPLYNSCPLPHIPLPPEAAAPPPPNLATNTDFSKTEQDQVLWTSLKVPFNSPRTPTHLRLWIYVFRKAQSFWLLCIKSINTFDTCKESKTGRFGRWNCSASYIAERVVSLGLDIAIHALLTCLWLPCRDKVKG